MHEQKFTHAVAETTGFGHVAKNRDILIDRLTRFLVSVIKLEALEEILFLTEKVLIIVFHKNVSHLVAIFTFAEFHSVENSRGFNANTVQ